VGTFLPFKPGCPSGPGRPGLPCSPILPLGPVSPGCPFIFGHIRQASPFSPVINPKEANSVGTVERGVFIMRKQGTGNRYQARSNFDVTSFQHHPMSSSFSLQNFIVGTNQPTNRRTDQPTDQQSLYRGATSRLKSNYYRFVIITLSFGVILRLGGTASL
jgi:hypothetical protein